MMKNSKGITLIALVVTIVVLLILAGVSINVLMGDNGIIRSAQSAQKKWQEAEENDEKAIEGISDYLMSVEVISYAVNKNSDNPENKSQNLICVYTDSTDTWYTYKDMNMFDISDSGYTYNGMSYEKVYGIFIDSDEEFDKANIKKVKLEDVTNTIKIDYSGNKLDVDKSGEADNVDASLAASVYNCVSNMFKNEDKEYGMNICFRSDVNRDKKVDEKDYQIIYDDFNRVRKELI